MSLASPSRITRSKEGWNAIEKAVDFTHAVGRVGRRGSCILISVPVPANSVHNGHMNHHGIVLTTSFVAQNRGEVQDLEVTFLEQPVTGSNAKGTMKTVTVPLRGDSIFYCSARAPPKRNVHYFIEDETEQVEYASLSGSHKKRRAADQLSDDEDNNNNNNNSVRDNDDSHADEDDVVQVEELGYTIVACDLQSKADARQTIRGNGITPLPLPLILSTIPAIQVGDTHLLVTHENSKARRYVIATVTEVFEHHCVYQHTDPTCQFSSGGSVFSASGDFIGLQHQCGESSYCIFIRDVVSHLFESGMLGLCKIPLLSADTEDARDEEGELNPNAAITDHEFNEPFSTTQRTRLIDVGAGDQIVNFEELQIVQRRKENGSIKGETVRVRRHSEVWDYWTSVSGSPGSSNYYRCLILLLAAFPYQSKLCCRILSELTSHENRQHIASVASHGGVGIMLEVLDSHPHDQTLVQTAVTSLARVSLYDANKESIARSDGVPVILAVMREFMVVYEVQQWALYLLLNLLEGQEANNCAKSIMSYAGLELILMSLERHGKGSHLQRWGWQAVGRVVRLMCSNPSSVAMIFRGLGGFALLVRRIEEYWKDGYVSFGLITALHALLRVDDEFENQTTVVAGANLVEFLSFSLPLHVHDEAVPIPDDDDGDDDAQIQAHRAKLRQEAAHQRKGCCNEATFFGLLFGLLRHHSINVQNESAPLIELLLVSYLDALHLRPSADFSSLDLRQQEVLVADVTLAFMTESRMHTIADKVMRYLGVPDPFGKYSHFMRDRNPNAHKDL